MNVILKYVGLALLIAALVTAWNVDDRAATWWVYYLVLVPVFAVGATLYGFNYHAKLDEK